VFAASRANKKWLGIAVGERSLTVAEVLGGAEAPPDPHATIRNPTTTTTRLAELVYSPTVTLESPQAIGELLQGFLREQSFSARAAVIGVPAKWLVLRTHEIPPTDAQTAAQMLWVHASASLTAELGPIVFDYSGQNHADRATRVLLMGLQQRWLDRLTAMADAARLRVLAVTPTAGALAAASVPNGDESWILCVGAESSELTTRQAGQTRAIRYIGGASSVSSLVSHVRRATLPSLESSSATAEAAAARHLVLWDEAGLQDDAVVALQTAAGMPIVHGSQRLTGVATTGGNSSRSLGAGAISLAMLAAMGRAMEIDFLHPRIAPPPQPRLRWRTVGIAAAIAAVVLMFTAGVADISRCQRQVSQGDHELAAMGPALAAARPFVGSQQLVESFHHTTPRYLACLRDLTLALPSEGQTCFTSFRLDANMKGQVLGHSDSERGVMGLIANLNSAGCFSELNRKLDVRDGRRGSGVAAGASPDNSAGGTAPQVSFELTFVYAPGNAPAAVATTGDHP
jgi:hypothetical protein